MALPPISLSMPSMAQSGVTAGFGDINNNIQSTFRGESTASAAPLVLAAAVGLLLAFVTRKRG